MLDTIRRAQPAIIKGVLGAVVLAFVATIFLDWGWRRSSRPDTQLATVGGESVSLREFQMILYEPGRFLSPALSGPFYGGFRPYPQP